MLAFDQAYFGAAKFDAYLSPAENLSAVQRFEAEISMPLGAIFQNALLLKTCSRWALFDRRGFIAHCERPAVAGSIVPIPSIASSSRAMVISFPGSTRR